MTHDYKYFLHKDIMQVQMGLVLFYNCCSNIAVTDNE